MNSVGQKVELDGPMFLREKKIQGCRWLNDFKWTCRRTRALPAGRLKLDEMITRAASSKT